MNQQKGFSLVELLIVVVIIGIIAAIAIPNLLSSRRAANEGSAVSMIRTIHGAQMTYLNTFGNGSFAGNMSGGNGVVTLSAAKLIDGQIGSGTKSGYTAVSYATAPTSSQPASFIIGSAPIVGTGPAATGSRTYLMATDGVIKYDVVGGPMTWDNSGASITITGGTALNN